VNFNTPQLVTDRTSWLHSNCNEPGN